MNSTVKMLARISALFLAAFLVFGTLLPLKEALAAGVDCKAGEKGCDYVPLTTIPGAFKAGEITNPVKVIKNIYGVSIGIAAVLAVGMIMFAGVEYLTTESIGQKSGAKERWQNAIYGLVLLLCSYLILRTINVDLVNVNLDLGTPLKGDVVNINKAKELVAAEQKNLIDTTAADAKRIDELKNAVNSETDPVKLEAKRKELYDAVRDADIRKYEAGTILGVINNSQYAGSNQQKVLDTYSSAIGNLEEKMNKGQIPKEQIPAAIDEINTLKQQRDSFLKRVSYSTDTVTEIKKLDVLASGELLGLQSGNTNVAYITDKADKLKKKIADDAKTLISSLPENDPRRESIKNDAAILAAKADQFVSTWKDCAAKWRASPISLNPLNYTTGAQNRFYQTYCAPYLGK